MSLLTPGTLEMVRNLRRQTFTHTYTWAQRIDGETDPEGGDIVAWAADVLRKPCHLLPAEVQRVDQSGVAVEVQAPRLVVPWDDPLDDGDLVKDVTTRAGFVLLSGPAEVQQTAVQVAGDEPTHKVASLDFRRSGR